MQIKIPEVNAKENELRILLAIKLLEERLVSLGKASEIAGYTERTFSEILVRRGVPPIRYEDLVLREESANA